MTRAENWGPVLDVRAYTLKPGRRDEFDRIMREEALPLLARHDIRVAAFGPSVVDETGYTLVRSFALLAEREAKLSGFYGSEEWLQQFDERVGALIETYQVVVLEHG